MPGGVSYIGDLTIVESGGEITSQSIGDKALLTTAADASTIEVSTTTGKLGIVAAGASLANGVQRASMSKFAGYWIQGDLVANDSAGGILTVQNTYGSVLIVTRAIIWVTTRAGDTCTIDVGVGDDAGASYNTLLDGLDVRTAAGVFDNITSAGTDGESVHEWGSTQRITGSMASGSASGLAGHYAFHVIDIN